MAEEECYRSNRDKIVVGSDVTDNKGASVQPGDGGPEGQGVEGESDAREGLNGHHAGGVHGGEQSRIQRRLSKGSSRTLTDEKKVEAVDVKREREEGVESGGWGGARVGWPPG